MLTFREHLGSLPVFGVRSLLLIFLVFCFVFFDLFVFVPCLVYQMFPVSLDCPFLIHIWFSLTFISQEVHCSILFRIWNLLLNNSVCNHKWKKKLLHFYCSFFPFLLSVLQGFSVFKGLIRFYSSSLLYYFMFMCLSLGF